MFWSAMFINFVVGQSSVTVVDVIDLFDSSNLIRRVFAEVSCCLINRTVRIQQRDL